MWMQEDLFRKQLPGPLSYTPNKQIDDNKWFNSRKLQKATQDEVKDPPPEGEAQPPRKWAGRPNH
jgi:hypothetical protein